MELRDLGLTNKNRRNISSDLYRTLEIFILSSLIVILIYDSLFFDFFASFYFFVSDTT